MENLPILLDHNVNLIYYEGITDTPFLFQWLFPDSEQAKILFQTKRFRKLVNFGARKSFKIQKWWESYFHFLVFYDFLL